MKKKPLLTELRRMHKLSGQLHEGSDKHTIIGYYQEPDLEDEYEDESKLERAYLKWIKGMYKGCTVKVHKKFEQAPLMGGDYPFEITGTEEALMAGMDEFGQGPESFTKHDIDKTGQFEFVR